MMWESEEEYSWEIQHISTIYSRSMTSLTVFMYGSFSSTYLFLAVDSWLFGWLPKKIPAHTLINVLISYENCFIKIPVILTDLKKKTIKRLKNSSCLNKCRCSRNSAFENGSVQSIRVIARKSVHFEKTRWEKLLKMVYKKKDYLWVQKCWVKWYKLDSDFSLDKFSRLRLFSQ